MYTSLPYYRGKTLICTIKSLGKLTKDSVAFLNCNCAVTALGEATGPTGITLLHCHHHDQEPTAEV